jgi:hypothetical protein
MLPKSKVSLVQVAKRQLALGDDEYRAILREYGGVESATKLDVRAFDDVMQRFRQLGFVSDRTRCAGGDRAGWASPAQIQLIRELWTELTVTGTERDLCRWLERHFAISSVPFLTRQKAAMVLGAMRKWQARKADDSAA